MKRRDRKTDKKVPPGIRRAYELAVEARKLAYAPYSKFKVGAALLLENAESVTGCNVENASYGGTVCAERTAIFKAVSAGNKKFKLLVVVTDAEIPASPCALCLQVMAEFFGPNAEIWVGNLQGLQASYRFADLLPHPFGPEQLKEARATKTEKS